MLSICIIPAMTGDIRKETGERLRAARERVGMFQADAARSIGKDENGQTWLSKAERGLIPVSPEDLLALARLYGTTVGKLLNEPQDSPRRPLSEQMVEWLEEVPREIPVYDQEAHAGFAASVIDYTWIDTEAYLGKNLAGVYIRGSCMEPEISAGDVAIVDRDATAQNGDVIVAFYEDTGLRIGRLSVATRGHQLLNGDGNHPLDLEQIQGVVVEVRKKLGRFKGR